MLSKNKIKLIRTLKSRRNRYKEGLFVVEGKKSVKELVNSNYTITEVYITPDFERGELDFSGATEVFEISKKVMSQISNLTNQSSVLVLVELVEFSNNESFKSDFCILLDCVQDPGNLGTIIRTCDWFGIERVFLSEDSVDFYNQKVIQGSMGSFARVIPVIGDLNELATNLKNEGYRIVGAQLGGVALQKYSGSLQGEKQALIMGNEGHGISTRLKAKIDVSLTIPKIGKTESLNVSTALAILLWEMNRSTFNKNSKV